MTEETNKEVLSALMDGEAQDLELRRVLKDEGSGELLEVWRRFQLAKTALHEPSDSLAFAKLDISAAVSAEIADDATAFGQVDESQESIETALPANVFSLRQNVFVKPLASLAVAASMAAVVVLGFGGDGLLQGAPSVSVVPSAQLADGRVYLGTDSFRGNSVGGVNVRANAVSVPRYENVEAAPEVDQESLERFQRYLLKHSEKAALNNGQGMVNYARTVHIEQK